MARVFTLLVNRLRSLHLLLIILVTFIMAFLFVRYKDNSGLLHLDLQVSRNRSLYEVRIQKGPTLSWLKTLDARPSCYAGTLDNSSSSLKSQTPNNTCNPTDLVNIDKLLNGSGADLLTMPVLGNVSCPREAIRAPFPLPSTGLVSFPGSGNTWARHLLQQLTGILTGSVYNSQKLKTSGFPGEGQIAGMVAIKTHFMTFNGERLRIFDRQILLLRNPFNAFIAEYKRSQLRAGKTGKADIVPNGRWTGWANGYIRRWSYFVRSHLAFPDRQLILLYEDLKTCPERELLHMAAFLKTDQLSQFSVCCALKNGEGKFYRKQGASPLRDLYQGKLLADMNNMLSALAGDVETLFPNLAQRLREYRV